MALLELVGALPADLPVPLVVVQHMPATFTAVLAAHLARQGTIGASEAVHGEPLRPGHLLVAPGGRHLEVQGPPPGTVVLHDGPRVCSCRPSVDVLFRSVAASHGASALGVVLTGMGRDGADGAVALRDAGASTLVQDAETSVVWGMPGAVVRARAADAVLPLRAIPGAITERIGRARRSA